MTERVSLKEAARLHFTQTGISKRFKACGSPVLRLAYKLLLGVVYGDLIRPLVYIPLPNGEKASCDNRRLCAFKAASEVLHQDNLEGTGLHARLANLIKVSILEAVSCPGRFGAGKLPQFSGQVSVKDLEDERLGLQCPKDYVPLLMKMLRQNPRTSRGRKVPPASLQRPDEELKQVGDWEASSSDGSEDREASEASEVTSVAVTTSEPEGIKALRDRLLARAQEDAAFANTRTAKRTQKTKKATRQEIVMACLNGWRPSLPLEKSGNFEEDLRLAKTLALTVDLYREAQEEELVQRLEKLMEKHGRVNTALLLGISLARVAMRDCGHAEKLLEERENPISGALVSSFMTMAKREIKEMFEYFTFATAERNLKRALLPRPPPYYLIEEIEELSEGGELSPTSEKDLPSWGMKVLKAFKRTSNRAKLAYPDASF